MGDDQMLTAPGTQSRRALLAGAGAVGAAMALAACGTDDETSPAAAGPTNGGSGATSGDPGATASGGEVIAKTSDIPVGGGAVFADKGVVVTQPQAGQFKGFSPICTHQGCPVSRIEGDAIVCTCHNSRFSIVDGSVKLGPARRPLPPKNIEVTGDQISLP
ncbi:Rieske (2Fe-2S) protein [Micromonospora sp. NPDC006766]|uniref:Rieske (2Fe-2S) protein n=1 Tax=Micromonospora sp. NPDC006766 TaxID=3154778 RepID=UPI0033C29381